MKTISKNFLPGILFNPIARDLILIFVLGFAIAVSLVTAVFVFFK